MDDVPARPVPGPHLFRRPEPPRWHMTSHAEERAEELGFTSEEVFRAVRDPEVSYGSSPDHDHPECRTYQRGDLAVVANPRTLRVVTVLLRTEQDWVHGVSTRETLQHG